MDPYWLVVLGVPVLAVALGIAAVVRRRGSRGFLLTGSGLAAAGVGELVLIQVWWREACWETWQPCEGTFLGTAPFLLFLALLPGILAMSIALAFTWGWYGPGGTRESPNFR